MMIGVLTVEIFIPASLSLKDKRRVLKNLKDRLKNSFNISIAEIEHHGKWQRAKMAIVNVDVSKRVAESRLGKVLNFIDKFNKVQLLDSKMELI